MVKEKGVCVCCRKPLPPRWGYVKCIECRMKEKDYHRDKVISKKHEEKIEEHHTAQKMTLDEMSIMAKEKHVSYGKLQTLETCEQIRRKK